VGRYHGGCSIISKYSGEGLFSLVDEPLSESVEKSKLLSVQPKTVIILVSQIAGGLCDNLLTCIVRAWDYKKPLFVAPAMNTFMWSNPFTGRHIEIINQLGISLVPPITKGLACGDYGNGAMAEPSQIHTTVRLACKTQTFGKGSPCVIPSSSNLV
jgi:phosphopantothenoylcysteine synthetase/decarboxylase